MPMYDYKCPTCGHTLSKIVKFNDPPPSCPGVGNEPCDTPMEKQVAQSSFQLKGGGWFRDQYPH